MFKHRSGFSVRLATCTGVLAVHGIAISLNGKGARRDTVFFSMSAGWRRIGLAGNAATSHWTTFFVIRSRNCSI